MFCYFHLKDNMNHQDGNRYVLYYIFIRYSKISWLSFILNLIYFDIYIHIVYYLKINYI